MDAMLAGRRSALVPDPASMVSTKKHMLSSLEVAVFTMSYVAEWKVETEMLWAKDDELEVAVLVEKCIQAQHNRLEAA